MRPHNFRADFPALTQRVRNKPWVYLDSAATALKPWPVIERISHFYTYQTANIHRGAFYLADQATSYFEEARQKVTRFINSPSDQQIIFTKGTTESINLVANSFAPLVLKQGDEILLTEMEHHANIVPWQIVAEKINCKIKVVKVNEVGELDYDSLQNELTDKVKILAITHCSNVLGTINDIKKITDLAHKKNAYVVVDGAQMVANSPVDVSDLNVDFYSFSAHKLFGPYGLGVLYGKKEHLEKMPPYQTGGSMISEVTFAKTTFNSLPFKFEAGTPHIEGVIGLGAAIDYILANGFESFYRIEEALLKELTEKLQKDSRIKIYGMSDKKAPIVSFSIDGLHSSDVAQILDQENVFLRSGHLCAQPLMNKFKVSGFIRASLSVFNNSQDIDLLIAAIDKAKRMLS
jgi:cysteine desulfurase/selenocysteine lyase